MSDTTPTESSEQPGRAMSRGRRVTIATLVTAGLATGGFFAAEGSFASGGAPSGSSGSASAPANAPANAPKPPAAPSSADLDGLVTAASSSSLTVRDDFGTSRTFAVTGSTAVHDGPTKSSTSALQVGERVAVRATKSGSTYTAKDVDIHAAHIDGVVKSISGDTLTVTDHDGFTRTITVTSSTQYTKDGKSADRGDLTDSSVVSARGRVDSDGTTLDATTVDIRTKAATPPARGPVGGPAGLPAPGGKGMPAAPKAGGPGKRGATSAPSAPKAPTGGASGAPSAAPSGARAVVRDRFSGRDRPDGADDDPTQQLRRLRGRDIGGDGYGDDYGDGGGYDGDTAQFPVVPDDELAAPPQRRRRRVGPGLLIGAGVLAVALILSGLTAVGVGPVSSLLGTRDAKDASRSPSTSSTSSSSTSSSASPGTSAPSSAASSSSVAEPSSEPSSEPPTQPSAAPKGPAGPRPPGGPRGRGGPAAPPGGPGNGAGPDVP